MVKTQYFHCRGHWLNPCGWQDPTCPMGAAKRKKFICLSDDPSKKDFGESGASSLKKVEVNRRGHGM